MIAYLSLGSNLGDPAANIRQGLERMSSDEIRVLRLSSLFETEPRDYADQAWFINAVAEVETSLSPCDLLSRLLEVEQQMGRVRTIKNGPRILDIDIVYYGNEAITLPGLEIPHPRIRERRFVLEPLAELNPDVRHPLTGESVSELLSKVGDQNVRRTSS